MKNFTLSAALIAALALSAQAASKLDTQVITATGFKNSLAQTADNLYVLDSQTIAERGYIDLTQALSSIPGISFRQGANGGVVDMRAQGERAISRVMLLVDGVLQNPADTSHGSHALNNINIDDVEQIEIIPGGGAVVYGGGAVGGVINVITKASKTKDFANVSLRYGSFNHFKASAAGGINVNDNVFLNFGFFALDEKGYQRADKHKSAGMHAGAKIFFADNQNIALNFRYSEDQARSSAYLSEKEMAQDRRAGGFIAHGHGPAKFAAENEPLTRSSVVDLSANYSANFNDEVELNFMPFYSKNNYDDGAFINSRYGAKLRGKFTNGALSSHLGYDYLTQQGKRDELNHGIKTSGDVKKFTHAIFAFENYKFNEYFDLSAGARYEHSNYKINRFSAAYKMPDMSAHPTPPGPPKMIDVPAVSFYDNSRKENNFAGSVIAGFNIDESNKIYAKFEHGFNSPGAYELTNKVKGQYVANDLKTEKFNNYEIGYKGLIAGQFASLAAYLTDTKDEIEFNMSGHHTSWEFKNIGKTRRMGVEASLEQSFLDDKLSLYENISYVHTKIKADPLHPNHVGQKIPQISPFSAAIGASYEFDSGFKIGADYRYYSKTHWNFEGDKAFMFNTPLPYLEKKAYGVLDLNASYKMKNGVSISAFAKNILGEKYNLENDGDKYRPAAKQSFYLELKYEY